MQNVHYPSTFEMYLFIISKYQVQVYNIMSTTQWPNAGLLLIIDDVDQQLRQRLVFALCSTVRWGVDINVRAMNEKYD